MEETRRRTSFNQLDNERNWLPREGSQLIWNISFCIDCKESHRQSAAYRAGFCCVELILLCLCRTPHFVFAKSGLAVEVFSSSHLHDFRTHELPHLVKPRLPPLLRGVLSRLHLLYGFRSGLEM